MFKTLTPAVLLALAAGSANAAITFSFADPAPGKQLTNTSSVVSYDTSNSTGVLQFIVGSNDGSLPTTVFNNARMEMRVVLGPATPVIGGFVALASGGFTIYSLDVTNTIRTDILTGTVGTGGLVNFGPSGAIITNSVAPNNLTYTAGPALTALLAPGQTLAPLFDAVFTLTDVTFAGGTPIIGDNVVNNFQANASFSGTSEVIPTPTGLALIAVGGLVGGRRRR